MALKTPFAVQPDLLDHVQVFLAKREGIDKTLKLIRYTSRLLASVTPNDAVLHKRCEALQSSLGVSRKAYRLGKFVQNINALRKSKSTGGIYLLELLCNTGEGIYYFIEQIVWLMKAGALTKEHEAQLAFYSACAETTGYVANIWLNCYKMDDLSRHITILEHQRASAKENGTVWEPTLAAQLAVHQRARLFRAALILQDLADILIAFNDIRGGGKGSLVGHPATLALAGLLSGSVSWYKNWTT